MLDKLYLCMFVDTDQYHGHQGGRCTEVSVTNISEIVCNVVHWNSV